MIRKRIEVHVGYEEAEYPAKDQPIIKAVGRLPDDTGCGFGQRDLSWSCKSKAEANRIAFRLMACGLTPFILTED